MSFKPLVGGVVLRKKFKRLPRKKKKQLKKRHDKVQALYAMMEIIYRTAHELDALRNAITTSYATDHTYKTFENEIQPKP